MVCLSVVMPTYNDSKYLPIAIEAILSQSFKDFELIIVNDASTDNTEEIILEYQRTDSRIRYFVNATNQGVVKTVNRACEYAQGTYLYGASSDDRILPGFFEKTLSLLLQNPSLPVAVSDYGYFNEGEEKPLTNKLLPDITSPQLFQKNEALALYRKKRFWVPGHTSIFKTEEVRKRGCFSEEIGYFCDYVLLNSIALAGGFVYIPETLALMRILPLASSRLANSKRKERIEQVDRLICYVKNKRELWKDFHQSTLLARMVNVKFYPLFLHPKHWDIMIPMMMNKLNLLFLKLNNRSSS